MKLSGCTCPGYTTFECTIQSGLGGATVWKGSALDCIKSNNEIVLLHSRFGLDRSRLDRSVELLANAAIVFR